MEQFILTSGDSKEVNGMFKTENDFQKTTKVQFTILDLT